MRIVPPAHGMGARIVDVDLAQPPAAATQARIIEALGRYGVVSFPGQHLTPSGLKAFSALFGTLEINVANLAHGDVPEVMTLSNIVEDGRSLGLADAGQGWHTDMSYSRQIALCNILYAIEVPHRDGEPLGQTEFSDMHAAYRDLPANLKKRLADATAQHDFAQFWNRMRARPASRREALTAEQRAARPPVSQPVFVTHPITGRKVLYANPGYTVRIDGMDECESRQVLDFLFEFQLRPAYRHIHRWAVGDVLMWDNIGTIHNAVADYRPDERRLIKRCQVAADRYFADGLPCG